MFNRESPSRSAGPLTSAWTAAAVTTLAAISLMAFAEAQVPAQPPQSDQVYVFTDYEVPPPTVDAAWDAVPIIVLARVQSSAVREKVVPGNVRVPFTEHEVVVLEVFKGAELLGAGKTLTVDQSTIEADATTRRVRHASGGRVFKSSEEYVLFLERLPDRAAFGVAWGEGGAYKVGETTVEVPGVSKKMWGYREISRHELITTLRAKRDKSHVKK